MSEALRKSQETGGLAAARVELPAGAVTIEKLFYSRRLTLTAAPLVRQGRGKPN